MPILRRKVRSVKLYMSMNSRLPLTYIEKLNPLNELYILCSHEYKIALKDRSPSDCKDFIADSGAFTAMNAGKTIDEQYVERYIKWINDNDIKNFIEMDLDEVIGFEKTLDIRKKIERETGKPVIPCWHLERGEQGWKDMCDEYDYVSISLSRLTKTSKWLQKNKFEPLKFFLGEARKRNCKVHALGCNDLNLLRKYKFYSADSSTHTLGARYGTVLYFDGHKLTNINKDRTMKTNPRKADDNNILQMIKVMKYAETHL